MRSRTCAASAGVGFCRRETAREVAGHGEHAASMRGRAAVLRGTGGSRPPQEKPGERSDSPPRNKRASREGAPGRERSEPHQTSEARPDRRAEARDTRRAGAGDARASMRRGEIRGGRCGADWRAHRRLATGGSRARQDATQERREAKTRRRCEPRERERRPPAGAPREWAEPIEGARSARPARAGRRGRQARGTPRVRSATSGAGAAR